MVKQFGDVYSEFDWSDTQRGVVARLLFAGFGQYQHAGLAMACFSVKFPRDPDAHNRSPHPSGGEVDPRQ